MNKSEFKKAVADNEAPTPGYLYRDMAHWTHADYATQLQLIKALFDKLQTKNSAFVLYKALHLIKVLCETGHEGFQKELQLGKYTSVMKDFTTFRGPLDIKYGDSWNERVRREAQAALEAVFQTRIAGPTGPAVVGGGGGVMKGDWSGTGSSAVDQNTAKGPWGSSGSDNPVMPSFSAMNGFGGAGGTAPSSSSLLLPSPQQQMGGLPPSALSGFDAPSLHIAEMPTENKWATHQQEMTALGSSRHPSASDKPSKTILQHIASTAKSGVGLMTQFEILKGKQARIYGDQFRQAARATTGPDLSGGLLGRGRGVDEVGSYQPVAFGVSQYSGDDRAAATAAAAAAASMVSLAAEPRTRFSPSPEPVVQIQAALLPANQARSDALAVPSTSSASPPAAGAASIAFPNDTATELLHMLARSKVAPSRVELSRIVRATDEYAAGLQAQSGSDVNGYAVQLASALCVHLAREKPWQERLNALGLLEAVLRGSAEPVRDGVTKFFASQPHLVQANYSVVQASLKEKAAKVAQLLNIPVVPAAPSSASLMSGNTAVSEASVDETNPQRSHFEDLLGGGASTSPSAAAPTSSLATLWGTEDTFEGMQIRTAASSGLRRGDATVEKPAPVPLVEPRGVSLGDGASRPQRRTNTAAPTSPSASTPKADGAQSRASIQIVRSSVSAVPAPTHSRAVHPFETRSGQLDDLLKAASPSPSATAQRAVAAVSTISTLDDLFGDSRPSATSQRAPAGRHDLTTDDLFGAPAAPSIAAPPAAEAAQLARIQFLMQHLETRYDPAAMSELETLILGRQQALQQVSVQHTYAAGAAVPVSDASGETHPHRQFQTGGQRSERQQGSNAFADVQAEMKRTMEL